MPRVVWSGPGLNANAIIARHAANHFLGAHNVAEPAKSPWQMSSTAPFDNADLKPRRLVTVKGTKKPRRKPGLLTITCFSKHYFTVLKVKLPNKNSPLYTRTVYSITVFKVWKLTTYF